MRWKIESFVFCDQQQTLMAKDDVHYLEPMVVELLAYFCRYPNQIISRDQLIADVWLGRVVTDNAVSKMITKLRKLFDDDPKKPRFIATFPKKGYKFIGQVSIDDNCISSNDALDSGVIETQHSLLQQPSGHTDQLARRSESKSDVHDAELLTDEVVKQTVKESVWFRLLLLFIILILGFVYFSLSGVFTLSGQNDLIVTITDEKVLTRSGGWESNPRMSPSEEYLSFTEVTNKKMRLWIKSMKDESRVEINHGDEIDTWVGPLSWSPLENEIVYLVTTPRSCQYFLRKFTGLTLEAPVLLHNCPAGSYGKIVFTHDENRLVFTESEGRHTPYSIFELDRRTGNKRRVSQPELYVGGNSQFDLHPSQNKLLISSPDKQLWEGFYSLDLDTDQLTLLFKLDEYICCGIWSHSGERVVLMGKYPAYQLLSYSLNGSDIQVIYSGSQQLRSPERHVNGSDYLFVAGYANLDIVYQSFTDNEPIVMADASVDDRLATFSYHDDSIAYVGLESSREEIWRIPFLAFNAKDSLELSNRNQSKLVKENESRERLNNKSRTSPVKMTQFNDGRHYIDLLWSYNGKFLIALTINEIHLIDPKTGGVERLKIPQVEISGISLKDDRTLAYRVKTREGWRVNYYDLEQHHVVVEERQWKAVFYAKNESDTIWIDQNNQLFKGKNKVPVTDKELLSVLSEQSSTLAIKKLGERWVWQVYKDGKYHLMTKTEHQPSRFMAFTNSIHFDLSHSGVLYHVTENAQADIYQTLKR